MDLVVVAADDRAGPLHAPCPREPDPLHDEHRRPDREVQQRRGGRVRAAHPVRLIGASRSPGRGVSRRNSYSEPWASTAAAIPSPSSAGIQVSWCAMERSSARRTRSIHVHIPDGPRSSGASAGAGTTPDASSTDPWRTPRSRSSSVNEVNRRGPTAMARGRMNEPAPLLAVDQALALQQVQRVAHGDARRPIALGQLGLRGHRVGGPELAVQDPRTQIVRQLPVQRRAGALERGPGAWCGNGVVGAHLL